MALAFIASVCLSNVGGAQVAMIAHLNGKVEVRLEGQSDWKSARLMQKLYRGADIRCGDSGEATFVVLKTGERFLLEESGRGKVGADSISGGRSLGGLRGASALAAKTLGGSRVGAALSRDIMPDSAIEPKFRGWFNVEAPKFHWVPVAGASQYTFTLFYGDGNVVWSARTSSENADFPAELPSLLTARPYIWRTTAFGKSGRPLADGSRWGVVTFLTEEQEKTLLAETEPLMKQMKEEPKSPEPVIILAEKYRLAGVYQRTLECIGALRLLNEPAGSVEAARKATYSEIGRLAELFSGGFEDKDKKKE